MRGRGFLKAFNLLIVGIFALQQATWSAVVGQFGISPSTGYVSGDGEIISLLGYTPTSYIKGIRLTDNGSIDISWEELRGEKEPSRQEKSMNLKFFLSALALPDDNLWVNLNVNLRDTRILGPGLNFLDLGKVFLASDLELKKDVKRILSQVRIWDRVMERLGWMDGLSDVGASPRFWIVPGRIEIAEKNNSMVIKKCRLKVKAEVRGDKRVKAIFESEIKRAVIPELERLVNNDDRYTLLRQAFYAIIAAMWYEKRAREGKNNSIFSGIIDKGAIRPLWSPPWSRRRFLNEYLELYKLGEIDSGWDGIEVVGGGIVANGGAVESATITSRMNTRIAQDVFAVADTLSTEYKPQSVSLSYIDKTVDKFRTTETADGRVSINVEKSTTIEEFVAYVLNYLGYDYKQYERIFQDGRLKDFLPLFVARYGQGIGGFEKGAEILFNKYEVDGFLNQRGFQKRGPSGYGHRKQKGNARVGILVSIAAIFAGGLLVPVLAGADVSLPVGGHIQPQNTISHLLDNYIQELKSSAGI